MQKSIALIISLFLLVSCTMAGNMPQKTLPVSPPAELTPKEENTTTSNITKNFGSGFVLTQNIDQTELSYSGKVIKTWSHIPPQSFPFGRYNPCAVMSQKIEPGRRDSMMGSEGASVWDTLSEKEKKACTAEYMMYLEVKSTPNPRFIVLRGYGYYGIFDTQILKTYGDTENEQPIQDIIQDIIFVDGHILLLTRSSFDASDEVLIFSENFEFQKKWTSQYADGRISIEKIENMSQTGVTLILKEFNSTTSEESSRKEMIRF